MAWMKHSALLHGAVVTLGRLLALMRERLVQVLMRERLVRVLMGAPRIFHVPLIRISLQALGATFRCWRLPSRDSAPTQVALLRE
jgi:hypothetical protein